MPASFLNQRQFQRANWRQVAQMLGENLHFIRTIARVQPAGFTKLRSCHQVLLYQPRMRDRP